MAFAMAYPGAALPAKITVRGTTSAARVSQMRR